MLKHIKSFLFRVAISVASLILLFYTVRGEWVEGLSHLTNIKFLPLLIAILINFLSLLMVTFRLNAILVVQSIRLSLSRIYYLWSISLFFNLFLPSAVGGDIAKAYYLYKDSNKKLASVTSVFLDRFFGMMATISIGFLAYLLGREHIDDPKIGTVLFWSAGVAIAGIFFLMSRRFSKPAKAIVFKLCPARFHERVQKLFDALDLYREHRVRFVILYIYSLLAQAMFIVLVYCLALSIRIELPIAIFFLFMPLVTVVSMIPSIGGLGVREAAMVYLFRGQVTLDQAVGLSLLLDLFLYGVGCVCGILYAIRGGVSIREIEQMEE